MFNSRMNKKHKLCVSIVFAFDKDEYLKSDAKFLFRSHKIEGFTSFATSKFMDDFSPIRRRMRKNGYELELLNRLIVVFLGRCNLC